MKTARIRAEVDPAARDVLAGLCVSFGVTRGAVLRVIVESVLDAASDDGAMQAELAFAARYLTQRGCVPWCGFDQDGGDDDTEPDEDHGGNDGDEDASNDGDEDAGDDGDVDSSDDGDKDTDTGERHDLRRVPPRSVFNRAATDFLARIPAVDPWEGH